MTYQWIRFKTASLEWVAWKRSLDRGTHSNITTFCIVSLFVICFTRLRVATEPWIRIRKIKFRLVRHGRLITYSSVKKMIDSETDTEMCVLHAPVGDFTLRILTTYICVAPSRTGYSNSRSGLRRCKWCHTRAHRNLVVSYKRRCVRQSSTYF